MKKLSLEDMSFHLLPSANPEKRFVDIQNKAFQLWQDVWKKVFHELQFDTTFLIDDFLRQDLIAVIMHKDTPAAVHLYSFFSLDCEAARAHRYMSSNFPSEYFTILEKAGIRNVMSMEYMTVHPEYRKSLVDLHVGQVLVGLATYTMREYGGDAAIAPARRDHKVHDLVYAMGGESVISNVLNHNVPCDLLMCTKQKVRPHADMKIRTSIEYLWKNRVFSTSIQQENSVKAAA